MFEEIRLEGAFSFTSGVQTNYFYDFNLLSPDEMAQYVKRLAGAIPKDLARKAAFIASPSYGGIVPGFLIAFALNKPFVSVVKDGTTRGAVFHDSPYLIVDDVVSTFQASEGVQKALGERNTCIGLAALMFRGSFAQLQEMKFPVIYLARGEQEV